MPVPSLSFRPDPTAVGPAPTVAPPPGRWGSLDVLRGVALCMMVVHHFARWTSGDEQDRIVGFEGFLLTDLAAPAFAVGVGAAALLVGRRIARWGSRGRARATTALWRWTQVLLAGLVLDLAVGGGIDGGGVLPTLAVLGVGVTALAAGGLRWPWAWWGIAAVCALLVEPALAQRDDGLLAGLLSGPFSIAVYGVFAAAGAAVAAHVTRARAGEECLPLVPAALGVVAVGVAGAWLLPDRLAPNGLWPPTRHPGDLAFTTWGLAATLLLWASVRWALPAAHGLGALLARAGRRTLVVFLGHYVVKLVLQHTDRLGTLDTWRWGVATWGATIVVCALACLPTSALRWRRPTVGADQRSWAGR